MSADALLFGKLPARQFLSDYWQQRPLLFKAALPAAIDIVTGDDLAGIACEPDGEARLVIGNNEDSHWNSEQGPFSVRRFRQLPERGWTLLAQSVDHWIPEVADLLDHFHFLPRWRIEDIMISYATDGGGVGPHYDNYDVFLLQTSGVREWRLGQRCDDDSPLRDDCNLKLLQDFDESERMLLEPGDMLYVPAGTAHWGTAVGGDCITLSVGFRAPAMHELLRQMVDNFAEQLPESLRYRDHSAAIDADPRAINAHVADTLLDYWQQLPRETLKTALVQAFGELVTEPRNAGMIQPEREYSDKQLRKKLAAGMELLVHPASRLAYRDLGNGDAELFVDGGMLLTSLPLARALCAGHVTLQACPEDDDFALLLALISQGSVIPL